MNEPQQPTEEQLLDALRQIKTEDVVLQTVATLVNLAGQKLSVEGAKDPSEAKKAIDAARHCCRCAPRRRRRRSRTPSTRSRCSTCKETDDGRADGGEPPQRPRVEDLDARLVIGDLRGLGLLPVPRRRRGGAGRHALRAAVGAGAGRARSRATDVAFMPRHGDEHTLPPHRINYRANVWAMKEVGVDRIIGPCACGSLKPELEPGHVRDLRPVRGPHRRPREHLLRRPADDPRLRGRPVLRRPAARSWPTRRARRGSRWWRAGRWS